MRFVLLWLVVRCVRASRRSEPDWHVFATTSQAKPAIRARALGIPFDGTPGKLNAITDVAGVEVGFTTLISGEGKLEVGKGPVRTGVTAIIPRGHDSLNDPVYAGIFSLNGNGEMTGTAWVEESGFLEGPVVITNTHSVGVARDAVIAWRLAHGAADKTGYWWSLPVVAETWDGWLNDINGFHVKPEDVVHALDTAKGGPVDEGSVGGGTGMICYEFKGGTGTASRRRHSRVEGDAPQLYHRRVLAGKLWTASTADDCRRSSRQRNSRRSLSKKKPARSFIVATDAPFLPDQLKRLARRVALGLARTGTISGNGSGDLFIAFSTANPGAANPEQVTHSVETIPNDRIDPIFAGVVQATEEAMVNALVDNHNMTGRDNHHVDALAHDRLRELLKKYNRFKP